jgi:hypothetical protein
MTNAAMQPGSERLALGQGIFQGIFESPRLAFSPCQTGPMGSDLKGIGAPSNASVKVNK